MAYVGNWHYDEKNQVVSIALDQAQENGSLFEMPLEIGIYYEDEPQPHLKVLQVNQTSNQFTIPVCAAPARIKLDPNMWVLMDVLSFEERK